MFQLVCDGSLLCASSVLVSEWLKVFPSEQFLVLALVSGLLAFQDIPLAVLVADWCLPRVPVTMSVSRRKMYHLQDRLLVGVCQVYLSP